jgi:hypothetical protein
MEDECKQRERRQERKGREQIQGRRSARPGEGEVRGDGCEWQGNSPLPFPRAL